MPPNYVGFGYDGQLQSIHHVDDYVIVTDYAQALPVPPTPDDPHYVLTLGPAIRPPHEVRTGSRIRRTARAWVDIDLLLTSDIASDGLTATQ